MNRQDFFRQRLLTLGTLIARESPLAVSEKGGSPVEIVAVTKAASEEDVLALAPIGMALAENRWEQLVSRQRLVREAGFAPPFHFIGALQRRSTRDKGVPVSLVGTVDRPEILPVLDQLALSRGVVQNILIEVDLTGIPGRSGVSRENLPFLLSALSGTRALHLKGILVMGVPPSPTGDLSETREIFRQGREIFDWLLGQWPGITTLSMGMSGDFLEAVRSGSTQVRLGTILFQEGDIR